MEKQFTVKEFLALSATQKQKIYLNNREQYDRLAAAVKSNYNPETDYEALASLQSDPKTSKNLRD